MDLISTLQGYSALPNYRVKVIDDNDLHRSYALVQISRPEMTLEDWGKLVTKRKPRLIDERAWIGIEDSRAYIHGLFYCQMTGTGDVDRILRISDLIAADLLGSRLLETAIGCAAFLAERSGAKALEFDIKEDHSRRAISDFESQLRSQGWRLDNRPVLQFRSVLR